MGISLYQFFHLIAFLMAGPFVSAIDYAYTTDEPKKTGWPLDEAERKYILRPEYERRPGSEQMKYLPKFWPEVPSAGFWTGTAWLDTHTKLVEYVAKNRGPIDILLAGDSITQQWGSPLDNKPLIPAWQKHFGKYKTINIGIGGDKSQNLLWRLDHGGVEGIEPRLVILMIGNNNMYFTPETGIEAAAKGIQSCVRNLREKFPKADLIVVKILPANEPGTRFYEDLKATNKALDKLNLRGDQKLHLLDLTTDFTTPEGRVKPALFLPDKTHLTPEAGYALYAEKLRPLVDTVLKK
jgi:lysophospholipase L1-like esterase